jgi:hypothetical protein
MPEITVTAATTELEAINAMLAAIGEAPVTSIAAPRLPDLEIAVNTLRDATRELLTQSWKFNTEYDLELAPTDPAFDWTDPDSSTVVLSVFEVPLDMAAWGVSQIEAQMGDTNHIDTVARVPKQYTMTAPEVHVFYDRDYNRDGFPASERTALWIDVIWYFDFEELPETARRLLTVVASRRYAASLVGSPTLVQFTQRDEQIAFRNFLRDQGHTDRRNMLINSDTRQALGNRRANNLLTGWTINKRW